MKNTLSLLVLSMILLVGTAPSEAGIHSRTYYKSSEQLVHDYPSIGEESERKENKTILCPFLRMLHRSGTFDARNPENNSQIMTTIVSLVSAAREFGCDVLACGSVASAVSAGQISHSGDLVSGQARFGIVNLSRLHKARFVAHECGLTFAKGGTTVDDDVRKSTLARMKEISDASSNPGELRKEDLMKVKLEICTKQNVEMSLPGEVEVGLIYSYLGGDDRGFIEYEDVVRLFHAEMPKTKIVKGLGTLLY
jgi:hypothetical protein